MSDRTLDQYTIEAIEVILETFDRFILTHTIVYNHELLLDLDVARQLIINRIGVTDNLFLTPSSALDIRKSIQRTINKYRVGGNTNG